jgi:L-lactate dehydrogenase complex protein LldG
MEREPFLAELSARLGRPRPRVTPVRDFAGAEPRANAEARSVAGGTAQPHALAQRFAHELRQVGGEVVLARSLEEVRAVLTTELQSARRVVSWARAELAGFELASLWRDFEPLCCEPASPDFRRAILLADVGVTGVDWAVADTGSLVLSAGPGRPRGVSLLPRLHIALLRESQLVPRLGLAFAGFRRHLPSAIHFITGPSRTSDIENDLAIGVHGPARVLAIVLLEAGA